MAKTLCDLTKELKSDPQSFAIYVRNATHVCKKCGRAANDKKRLCKPVKLEEPDPSK